MLISRMFTNSLQIIRLRFFNVIVATVIDCLVLGPTYIHFNQFVFAYKLANDMLIFRKLLKALCESIIN